MSQEKEVKLECGAKDLGLVCTCIQIHIHTYRFFVMSRAEANLLTSPWMSGVCPSGGQWRNCRAADAPLTMLTL